MELSSRTGAASAKQLISSRTLDLAWPDRREHAPGYQLLEEILTRIRALPATS